MKSARPLTESALAAAVCVVVWALSMGLPGVGGYVRYMTPSLIAIVGARHGARWSLAACAVAGAGIGIMLGPTQLLICLSWAPHGRAPSPDEAADGAHALVGVGVCRLWCGRHSSGLRFGRAVWRRTS